MTLRWWLKVGMNETPAMRAWWDWRHARIRRAIARMTAAAEQFATAVGQALVPSLQQAGEAIRQFGEAWARGRRPRPLRAAGR